MTNFTIDNWYWMIGGDESRVWSSARAMSVPTDDAVFVAWCADGARAPSRIASDAELAEVFGQRFPAGMLSTYNAAKRFEIETGGVTIDGTTIDTTRESQSMIANAYAYVTASDAPQVSYKAASGWVTLTAEQIKLVALAAGSHVQACFAKEALIDAQITVGSITTIAQVDAAYQAAL